MSASRVMAALYIKRAGPPKRPLKCICASPIRLARTRPARSIAIAVRDWDTAQSRVVAPEKDIDGEHLRASTELRGDRP